MILSQSNGVVLNSTHELYSCKANCISGGSYFRITIALNYSTWLLVIQTGVWSQILLLVFPQKAGSARSRKHHNEHFHIETKGKDASSNVPQSKLKPKGAWKSVKMTNRQIKYGHLTLKMANFTGCLAPIFDPYPLHEMNLARNRDLQRSFAEN